MLNDVSVSMYSCVHCSVFIRSYCHLSVRTPTVLWISFCHNFAVHGFIAVCLCFFLFHCWLMESVEFMCLLCCLKEQNGVNVQFVVQQCVNAGWQ